MKPAEPISLVKPDSIEDASLDFHPKTFEDYLGQKELKEKLYIYTTAAQQRNDPLDHLLLFGPPGLGKTTLAQIMAHTMDTGIKICSGPMLDRTGDVVALLTALEPRDILFIDEIHRMPTAVEEVLYSSMEHFRAFFGYTQSCRILPVGSPEITTIISLSLLKRAIIHRLK